MRLRVFSFFCKVFQMHVQLEQPKGGTLPTAVLPLRKAALGPRILLAGRLTGMAAPGGEESQMLGLAEALPFAGVAETLAAVGRPLG